MRIGECLISTERDVYTMSTIMRQPLERRWSLTMINAISGTPGHPVFGSSSRKLVAFARKAPNVQTQKPTYVPLPEVDIEPRQAKVQNMGIDTHGPSEKCPGCRAYKRWHVSSHTHGCLQATL